jgi:transcriptional regulator of heat shock response
VLDSFILSTYEKGKSIIDTYKKQKNTILFILEGSVEVVFPRFISAKSQKILSSIKEIKNINKENFDQKQLFGLEALKKAACNEKTDDYFEYNVQLVEKGKVARTSLAEIEKLFGCNFA